MDQIIEIYIYETDSGKKPYNIWFNSLDKSIQVIIDARFERVKLGNFGNHESLKNELWELKFDFGPGYRIYFARLNNQKILILNGGTKRNKSKDINKAKEYWLDFKEKNKEKQ